MTVHSERIGSSLPFPLLAALPEQPAASQLLLEQFGGLHSLLEELAEQQLDTVELRAVSNNFSPQDVLTAAENVVRHGLGITIHGSMRGNDTAESFYSPYQSLFRADLQEVYNITVHPLEHRERTEQLLTELCDAADRHAYPVQITLENNRHKPGTPCCGDSTEAVGSIVSSLNLPRLGACWDFGHFYSNCTKFTDTPNALPPAEFLRCARHTHIHGLTGGRTHFPLDSAALPLTEYCRALRESDYSGVYSLELDFTRFFEQIPPRDALLHSIRVLKEVLHRD